MGRSFVAASSEYIEVASVDLSSAATLTFSGWYFSSAAGATFLFNQRNESGATFKGPYIRPRNSGGSFEIGMGTDAGANITLYTATRPTDSVWHHVMGTWNRATRVCRAWIDGVELTLSATLSGTFSGNFASAILRIGRYASGQYLDGKQADLAFWNAEFAGAEASRLARGESPLRVRPDLLAFYMPLLGTNQEPLYGRMGVPLPGLPTISGTAAVAHPHGFKAIPRPTRKALVTV